METASFARDCEICLEVLLRAAVERFGPDAVRRIAFGVSEDVASLPEAALTDDDVRSEPWSLASRVDFDE